MFYFDEIHHKKILKSDLLQDVQHFFTTRESVIKTKNPEMDDIVIENKKDICNFLNIKPENLIQPCQTHSANIEIAVIGKSSYPETDGLILTNKEQAIFLNFADCTPIIFYDKKKHIAAISHAGWRGTEQQIGPQTVYRMMSEFDCQIEDIVAVIGPAISLCCYNVGEDVYEKLKKTVKNDIDLFEKRDGKIFVDLKAINCKQLEEIGLKDIDVCPYCTSCDNDMFYSYRKENATTNRHSAVVRM